VSHICADAFARRSTRVGTLGVDYVDLPAVHGPIWIPLAETMGALAKVETLAASRHVGVANSTSRCSNRR
jgi:diketogulonate reductase-like aldo/keto reductase